MGRWHWLGADASKQGWTEYQPEHFTAHDHQVMADIKAELERERQSTPNHNVVELSPRRESQASTERRKAA